MKYFENAIIEEVLQLRRGEKTNREIAKHFGLRNIKAVRNLIRCHRQK